MPDDSKAEIPASFLRKRRVSAGGAAATATATAESLASTAKQVEARVGRALLLLWDELPEWRRDNAFIRGGYRATSNSYRRSLASVAYLHNESVNIWSHLLGAVGFGGIGGAGLFLGSSSVVVLPRYGSASGSDVLVFSCFFAGALLCLGMSATFHALCNHSPAVATWANKLDYSGIVFLIVGSYVPALYYGFFCLPRMMTVYLYMVSLQDRTWYVNSADMALDRSLSWASVAWSFRGLTISALPHGAPIERSCSSGWVFRA